MDKRVVAIVAVVAAAALLGGGWYLWHSRQAAPPYEPPVAQAPAEVPASAPPPVASEPAIRHPVEEAQAQTDEVPNTLDTAALVSLLGQKAVLQFLQADGFVARVVATIDNLPRPHAAPRLWPVNPVPGRFTVEGSGQAGGERIAAANMKRYTPFVRFVEGVDSARAATLYLRHYKQFQQAYVELGYPNGYFNDRLVEVIDHLLDTPEVPVAPAVDLIEVKGATPSTQPWTHYEFVDAGLQGMSSGRKVLVRLGPEQARRIKAKLAEFRRLVTKSAR
jgi:hypothetical protein